MYDLYDVRKKVVFNLQPTKSFPDGPPQREEYETDDDFEGAIDLYCQEWRIRFKCEGCNSIHCPQCLGGFLHDV